jgi:hypothetical protein
MYEFVFCFVINGRIEWSSETANSLSRWLENEEDQQRGTDFIENSQPGDFVFLKKGTLIFRCAPSPIKPSPPAPRPLMDVLEDAGLLDDDYDLRILS